MSKPNLLFLMPDQLRYDFLSCYGASFIDTPHIDSLAAEGLRYDCAYSTSPVAAARHSLLTGLNLFARACWATGSFCVPTTHAAIVARANCSRRLPQRRYWQDALLPGMRV